MTVLFDGLTISLTALLGHVLYWRLGRPKTSSRLLFIFFGFYLIISQLILLTIDYYLSTVDIVTVVRNLHVFILSSFICSAYIASYPAIEANSPSILICNLIRKSGAKGISEEALYETMGSDLLLYPRIVELEADGLVLIEEDIIIAQTNLIRLANFFIFFRNLLKLPIGG